MRAPQPSKTINTTPVTVGTETEANDMTATHPTYAFAAERRVEGASGWSNASTALAIRAA